MRANWSHLIAVLLGHLNTYLYNMACWHTLVARKVLHLIGLRFLVFQICG